MHAISLFYTHNSTTEIEILHLMFPVGPTTRGPGCQPEVVEQCLVSLASNITLTDDPDYDLICK